MAKQITVVNDYTAQGEFFVGLNNNDHPALTAEIARVEQEVFEQLLGVREYNKYQTDLSAASPAVPTQNKWIDFVTGATYIPDEDPDISINFKGVRDRMIKGFIFFFYMRDMAMKRTGTGMVQLFGENSQPMKPETANGILIDKYNIGVRLYCEAQEWLKDREEVTGQFDSLVEGPAGTYTMTLNAADEAPEYLIVGDTVTLDLHPDESFTVTIVDYSGPKVITMTATAGLGAGSGEYTYEPFTELKTEDITIAGIY